MSEKKRVLREFHEDNEGLSLHDVMPKIPFDFFILTDSRCESRALQILIFNLCLGLTLPPSRQFP
jgi:hypothetical protein